MEREEKVLISYAIKNEIENLEAEIRVKEKDILFLDCDEEEFFDNYIDLIIDIESLEEKIFRYKEILKKLAV